MDNLTLKPFSEINLEDHFFDSLRNNYDGFDDWFKSKASSGAKALVYYSDTVLLDFLYLKDENESLHLDVNTLPPKRRLEVGTFKIERRGTNRGERFMKRILDIAIQKNFSEVYVTMFDDTDELLHLRQFFEQYGFIEIGRKSHNNGRSESVLLRDLTTQVGNLMKDYPYIDMSRGKKYLLAVKPEYHTNLFPDSILKTECYDILKDVSQTNSINKIYICWMKDARNLRHGDNVIIYRMNDGRGPASYRSVATSVCTVSEIKTINDFADIESFIQYANRYSVFSDSDLRKWYNTKSNFIVVKLLYNIAFQKKVIRKDIIEQVGVPSDAYWGILPLSNNQFSQILNLGNADGRYIIN